MDTFDFASFQIESKGYPGSYYVEQYNIVLPIRIYNLVKNKQFFNFETFYEYLTILLDTHTSKYLFSGDIVFFYPSVREQKAATPISCHVSGAPIAVNEFYYAYRPLIDNLTTGEVYTIKHTLKVSSGYEGVLPQSLSLFEELSSNFTLGLNSNGINFYDFSTNAGQDALDLKLLSKRKRLL